MNHLKQNCEAIDATVFSSDMPFDPERVAELKEYMGRWGRELGFYEPVGYVVHYSGKMVGPSAGHAGIVSSVTSLDAALSLKGDEPKRTVRAVYLDAPGEVRQQGAEAVRLLGVMRDLANRVPEASINRSWVLALIDLAKHEAEAMTGSPFVQMLKEESDAYCQILALLGMEEEGDPVVEVERLIGIADKWFKGEKP